MSIKKTADGKYQVRFRDESKNNAQKHLRVRKTRKLLRPR